MNDRGVGGANVVVRFVRGRRLLGYLLLKKPRIYEKPPPDDLVLHLFLLRIGAAAIGDRPKPRARGSGATLW